MMVMTASTDLWTKLTPMTALSDAVNGLGENIDRMLHLCILYAGLVQDMFHQIHNIYWKNNGKPNRFIWPSSSWSTCSIGGRYQGYCRH